MPTNLGPEAISAIKAGHADVVAMYAGDTQIFPNEVVLQSAAYTDTSNMSTTGGSRIFRVTGEIGCSYSLSGSLSGSYNLATSIGHNSTLFVSEIISIEKLSEEFRQISNCIKLLFTPIPDAIIILYVLFSIKLLQ